MKPSSATLNTQLVESLHSNSASQSVSPATLRIPTHCQHPSQAPVPQPGTRRKFEHLQILQVFPQPPQAGS